MRTPLIKTTPGILTWARETLGYSLSDVSKKHHISITTLKNWEKGGDISVSQLKKLANRYKRSMGVFFLPNVPKTTAFPFDFRTLDSVKQEQLSKEVRLAVRKARRNRDYFEELSDLLEEDILKITDTISFKTDDDVERQIAQLRDLLGIDIEEQYKFKDTYTALRKWIDALEENGLLIFQMLMPLDKKSGIRAFCLRGDSNKNMPVIVLNTKDSPAGRIFSLFHELAHLLIPRKEIEKIERQNAGVEYQHQVIEKYANLFAGSFLVPTKNLLELPQTKTYLGDINDDIILSRLAGQFRVSKQVMLRRFLDLGHISNPFYKKKQKKFIDEFNAYKETQKMKSKEKGGGGGPRPAATALSAVGNKLSRKLFEAKNSDKISYYDVVRFYEIKQRHVQNIESNITVFETKK